MFFAQSISLSLWVVAAFTISEAMSSSLPPPPIYVRTFTQKRGWGLVKRAGDAFLLVIQSAIPTGEQEKNILSGGREGGGGDAILEQKITRKGREGGVGSTDLDRAQLPPRRSSVVSVRGRQTAGDLSWRRGRPARWRERETGEAGS
jgi:hypothetical protein